MDMLTNGLYLTLTQSDPTTCGIFQAGAQVGYSAARKQGHTPQTALLEVADEIQRWLAERIEEWREANTPAQHKHRFESAEAFEHRCTMQSALFGLLQHAALLADYSRLAYHLLSPEQR